MTDTIKIEMKENHAARKAVRHLCGHGKSVEEILESLCEKGLKAEEIFRFQIGETENKFSAVPHGMLNEVWTEPIERVTIRVGNHFFCEVVETTYWHGGCNSGHYCYDTEMYRDYLWRQFVVASQRRGIAS